MTITKKCTSKIHTGNRMVPIHDMCRDRSALSGYKNICKRCKAIQARSSNKKAQEKARIVNRDRINRLKSEIGCTMCPEKDSSCLDWHHKDAKTKSYSIANILDYKWDTIISECKKCIVVCSNCHRKIHAGKIKQKVVDKVFIDYDLFDSFK